MQKVSYVHIMYGFPWFDLIAVFTNDNVDHFITDIFAV